MGRIQKSVVSLPVLILVGCRSGAEPCPRFTYVDTGGRTASFIMFDQKTGQTCWGGNGGSGEIVSIETKTVEGVRQTLNMPLCSDLLKR